MSSKTISREALAEFAARAFAEEDGTVSIYAAISGVKFEYDDVERKFFEIDAPSYLRIPMVFYIDYMNDIEAYDDGHVLFTDSMTSEDFSLIIKKQSWLRFDDYVKD